MRGRGSVHPSMDRPHTEDEMARASASSLESVAVVVVVAAALFSGSPPVAWCNVTVQCGVLSGTGWPGSIVVCSSELGKVFQALLVLKQC